MCRYIILKDREVRIPDGEWGVPIAEHFPDRAFPKSLADHVVYVIDGETLIVKPMAIRPVRGD